METHGVANQVLEMVPYAADMRPPREASALTRQALTVLPFVSLLGIWGLVQIKNLLRGDSADRAQLKRKMMEEQKEAAEQKRKDEQVLNIASMVRNGFSDGALDRSLGLHASCMYVPYDC